MKLNEKARIFSSPVVWVLILAIAIFVGTWIKSFSLANGQNTTQQMDNATGKQTLRGLATVNFYATDMQAAKKWYSELLGIEPYFTRPNPENPAYIEYRIGDLSARARHHRQQVRT